MNVRRVCCSALGVACVCQGLAFGADAPPADSAALALDPVVITVERRPQTLQQVATSITAFDGAQLRDRGVRTIDDLPSLAPGLSVSDASGEKIISIRGIGKQQESSEYPSGVVVATDGVALLGGYLSKAPYFDLADIAVLRGPQGAFGGQDAIGGMIQITTNSPELGDNSADVEFKAGNYGRLALTGAVNLPVGDTLALRLAFVSDRRKSYYTLFGQPSGDSDPGRLDARSLRLGLLWKPDARVEALWKVESGQVQTGGTPASHVPTDASGNANSYGAQPLDDLFRVGNTIYNQGDDRYTRMSLSLRFALPTDLTLRTITGFLDGHTDQTNDLAGTGLTGPFDLHGPLGIHADLKGLYQEVTLLSPEKAPLRWLGGVYGEQAETHFPAAQGGLSLDYYMSGIAGVTPTPIPLLHFLHDLDYQDRNAGVFGQLAWELRPDLELQVSARHNMHRSDHLNVLNTVLYDP
ncbi:MAG: TonB-dependent receptor, partial [Rhodoferax sp.]